MKTFFALTCLIASSSAQSFFDAVSAQFAATASVPFGSGQHVEVSGNGVAIPKNGDQLFPAGSDGTWLENVCADTAAKRTFTVKNNGESTMFFGANAISVMPYTPWGDAVPGEFTVTQLSSTSLASGKSLEFEVSLMTSKYGDKYGYITISFLDGSSFSFNVGGRVIASQLEMNLLSDVGRPVPNYDITIDYPASQQYVQSTQVMFLNFESCPVEVTGIRLIENKFRALGGSSWFALSSGSISTGGFTIPTIFPQTVSFSQRIFTTLGFISRGIGEYEASFEVLTKDNVANLVVTTSALMKPEPTDSPSTLGPTSFPTSQPTRAPTPFPTMEPTAFPTFSTLAPTVQPTVQCNDMSLNGEVFEDPVGYDCAWYATGENFCAAYGNDGIATSSHANKHCCVCGGGLIQEEGGFDFQSCDGGSDTFTRNLPTEGETFDIGVIPAGQVDLYVRLTALDDLDIRLFDMEATEDYSEGLAVVGWCNESDTTPVYTTDPNNEKAHQCNLGVLNGLGEESTTYKGMTVTYSGYNGVKNCEEFDMSSPCYGVEEIRIQGATTVPLKMQAYAYKAGTAQVDYSWSWTFTDCCKNTGKCTGAFSESVSLNEVSNLGDIPIGKEDLNIFLDSNVDIDIQLYDADANQRAIIAYCDFILYPELDCATFAETQLGDNIGKASASYKSLTYEYSGYFGVDGMKGNEYIKVLGVTNTRLTMKILGYEAGSSIVNYEYKNGPPSDAWTAAYNAWEATQPQPQPQGPCQDKTLADGSAWNDNFQGVSVYDCNWYGSQDIFCEQFGDTNSNEGMTANIACCACGGGE